jgi:8-oxo-dGTP pyrophosphatase MutT (NUDIX family)
VGSSRADARRTPLERRDGAVARLRSVSATSAGGLVIRVESGRPQLVVGIRRRERDRRTTTLPKGTPIAGETLEETALREVGEETGLEVRITAPIGSIAYSFAQRGLRVHKTVHYFLMEPVGGDLARHDHEFEQVLWLDLLEARERLTFETERDLIARAAIAIGLGFEPAARAAGSDTDRATGTEG